MIPSILSTEKFDEILSWLDNPEKTMPEDTDTFLTTLNLLYLNRKEEDSNAKRRRPKTANVPSIKHMMETDETTLRNEEKAERMSHVKIPKVPDMPKPVQRPLMPTPAPSLLPTNEDGYRESGIDGKILADAIMYKANLLSKKMSASMVQMIMYIIYGVWIAKKNERIITEHPRMHQFGPLFSLSYAYQKRQTRQPDREAFAFIQTRYPELFELLERTVMTNIGKAPQDLESYYKGKATPWQKCNEANPEQWGKVLSDKDIEKWFKRKLNSQK